MVHRFIVSVALAASALSLSAFGAIQESKGSLAIDDRPSFEGSRVEQECDCAPEKNHNQQAEHGGECACAGDYTRLSDADIYGSELMSVRERDAYRQQLQDASSSKERKRVEANHRQKMDQRAESQSIDIAPPGQGIYGGALMSVEERNRFRAQLRAIDQAALPRFLAIHREEMQARARKQGIAVEALEETEETE